MYIEVKKKTSGKYEVAPDITPSLSVDSIDFQIPCFSGTGDSILIAVDSQRKIITDVSNIENATMILDVSSGGGNARTCYRADDSSVWSDFGPASSSIYYYDNCTFEMDGTTLKITVPDGVGTQYYNFTPTTSPLSYISVGSVGS